MVVKVYSASWCSYCHVLMDWLDSLGVEYKEVDIENAPESEKDKIQSVPVTEIGGTRIIGLDRPAIKKALKKEGLIK